MELPSVRLLARQKLATRSLWLGLVFVLAATAGCKSLRDLRIAPLPEKAAMTKPLAAADSAPSAGAGAPLLADDGWILPRVQPEDSSAAALRWRHARLDAALASPPEERPDFAAALASDQPVVAANAAIMLARLGSGEGSEVLVRTIRSRQVQPRLRLVAAEALGLVQQPSPAAELRKLLDEHNASPGQSNARLDPDMQAELLRAFARHQQPADDPRFSLALDSPAPQVRTAALDVWGRGRPHTLPVAAVALRQDQSPLVRSAALRAIVAQQHPHAHEYLSMALRDSDIDVRLTAAAALGQLGTQDARITLEGLLKDDSERVRAAAMLALARMGSNTMLPVAIDDKAWRVRAAAAASLAALGPNKQTLSAARALLADSNLQVQKQLIDSLKAWPLTAAGPLLLQAIDEAPFVTRQAAAAQLAARWPPAAEFRADAPPERLAAMRAELHERWNREFGNVDRATLAAAYQSRKSEVGSRNGEREDVERWLKALETPSAPLAESRGAVSGLSAMGPELLVALDSLAERGRTIPEAVYHEVLPKVDPIFDALNRLDDPDASERRRAAGQLAESSAPAGMHPVAMRRLTQQVTAEPDPLVWSRVLQAIANDASPEAGRLALAGLTHPSAEVRRRACMHLGEHYDPRYASPLLKALSDGDASVAQAAVRALAEAGSLDDTRPVASLLTSPDKPLRVQAAVTLARLGAADGPAALERLAFDPDLNIRREAAEAMGSLADPQFTATLIRLLDERADISRAALHSLQQVAGADAPTGITPLNPSEQVVAWKKWWKVKSEE
jgi:HEAT repeat protein